MDGILSTPRQHQLDCLRLTGDKKAWANFSDMGTGKTLMCLMTAVYLYKINKIKRILVVAPRGCYGSWYEDDIPKHLDPTLPYRTAYWSSYQTVEVKKQLAALEVPGQALRILVINIEALNSGKVADLAVDFMKKEPTLMVVDESTTIKSPNAKRTRVVQNVGKFAEYRRICTGNPIPNGPMDLYEQTEFLQENFLGYQNYFAFRNRFCVMKKTYIRNKSINTVVGYRDLDLLHRMMHKFAFIIKKENCLDLPPKVYTVVDVTMGKLQQAAYDKMLDESLIMLNDGDQVSAQIVITQLLRLHQIACGFMRTDGGQELAFDEPNDRLNSLIDRLEQVPGKVIVWANYRYNIRQIMAAITERFGQTAVHYYGESSDEERREAKVSFQDPASNVRFMVSNPATGRFGNTWTAATTVIYYSNSYDLEARDQSEDRAHRIGQEGAVHSPGQDPSVLYIDLRAKGTVDDRIIRVLKAKKKLTDEIVRSNWKWLMIGEQG